MPTKSKPDPLPARSFRLSESTMNQLLRVAAHFGLSSRTEAIRFLARQAAKKIPEKTS